MPDIEIGIGKSGRRAYDLRECPECCAIVCSDRGQNGHADWHEDLDPGTEEETGVLEMAGENSE